LETATSRRRPGRPAGRQGADLLAVAREAFLELGFAGTTMQEVAARAGISKASLYKEHESKDELFAAVVIDWAARGRGAMRPLVERLLDVDDIHAALVELASTVQAAVLAPDVIRMRRLVSAESDRFPDIANAYLAASWDSNIAVLADVLAELNARGTLNATDPLMAAHQFTWTAVGAALNAHTIAGDAASSPPRKLRRFANAAADMLTGGGPGSPR
jgi:TetR/AcrR family transcriptional repressor of mexJK operon